MAFQRALLLAIRYLYTSFSVPSGTFNRYSLPLHLVFRSNGHFYSLFVTATALFPFQRALLLAFRYRYGSFSVSTGTFTRYSLPLHLVFRSNGHIYSLFVTATALFPSLRARLPAIRYRYSSFFVPTGTFNRYSLPLRLFFRSNGYIYSLFVTATALFPFLRARLLAIRYRYSSFSVSTGTFIRYSLPLRLFWRSNGHILPLFVTSTPLFPFQRAHLLAIRYRYGSFFVPTGTFTRYSLPLRLFFSSDGTIIYWHAYEPISALIVTPTALFQL